MTQLRILHLQSSFDPGGKEVRAAMLINAFGGNVAHSIVSAQPGATGAAALIDRRIAVDYPADFPSLSGRMTPARLLRLAAAMRGYDLILTYNWGAMDAVMAHTLYRDFHGLAPLVHHEDGFNQDETQRLKTSRNWYRRIGLGRASALVVPSRRLERIALDAWRQPPGKVRRIGNGVDVAAYGRKPKADALPRVIKRPGEKWLGTIAGLRAVKNLPRLVRAFAAMPAEWQLVIAGEGPERETIRDEAQRLGLADRVHLPGFVAEPAKAIGLFDLFALASDSEQFPISVVEAMAAGLAVASPDVGDVAVIVAEENRPYIAPAGDEAALTECLLALASDPALRQRVGEANRALALAEYDQKTMIARYRAVYAEAMRRPQFP